MHRGYTVPALVTGKPVSIGGSEGRVDATGRGVFIAARETARRRRISIDGATVAIECSGNVGSAAGHILVERVGPRGSRLRLPAWAWRTPAGSM